MLCINLESTDPFFNLALEEFYFKTRKDDFFIININSPSIIIGKHQIANEEINNRFVEERHIPVIRRITGGGTVYHDHGNINFTFISTGDPATLVDFRKHTLPITAFLKSQDVDASFEGKNDIRTGGLKISGNAEHVFKNRILHHGTLLYNSTLSDLSEALLISDGKYESRAVSSNRTSVTNLTHHLPDINSATELKSEILKFIFITMPDTELYKPGSEEILEISALAKAKYESWEWNYAYGPAYRFTNKFEFRGEAHCCDLNIKDGIISSSRISGSDLLRASGKEMAGKRHLYSELAEFLDTNFPGEGRDLAFKFF